MGKDKALLPFLGQPLIQRVIERVSILSGEILVVTNQLENYHFLGVRLVQDILPGRGSLGGLYTALQASRADIDSLVGVVACDMPFVDTKLLEAEIKKLINGPFDAVIPLSEHGSESFHAIYHRSSCLPAIEKSLQAGKWRVNSWFPDVHIYHMTSEETVIYDPKQWAFMNINTPADLTLAEELAIRINSLSELH
jgi:molybdopterin-guanine dinucleotide biosynthesis protein A